VIWGLPYLFIRVAVEHLSPGTLVFYRTALASLVLLPVALYRREIMPVLRRWKWVLTFAVIEVMIPWLLLSHAEQRISSSLAGLLVAGVPIIGALLAVLIPNSERINSTQAFGLGVGIIGVATLVGIDFDHLELLPILEMAVVAVCYALGPIILARSLSDLPGLGVISCSLAVTAVVFAPFAIAQPARDVSASVAWSVIVLALVCTALAFILLFQLIATIGPTRATVITYVNPAVALALGVAILDEQITTGMVVGFPLILLGSILGARKAAGRAVEPVPVG
jgi:drug/metabolite transporter (DMT)-like permease